MKGKLSNQKFHYKTILVTPVIFSIFLKEEQNIKITLFNSTMGPHEYEDCVEKDIAYHLKGFLLAPVYGSCSNFFFFFPFFQNLVGKLHKCSVIFREACAIKMALCSLLHLNAFLTGHRHPPLQVCSRTTTIYKNIMPCLKHMLCTQSINIFCNFSNKFWKIGKLEKNLKINHKQVLEGSL